MKRKSFVLLGLLFCLSAASCGEKPAASVDEGQAAVNQEETEEAGSVVQTEEEESETEEAPAVIHAVGEMTPLNDWEITVTNFQIVDNITSDMWEFTPSEGGNKFAQVFVTLNNKGAEADTFLPSLVYNDDVMAQLVHGEEEFSQTQLLNYDNDLANKSIDPGAPHDGELVFEIPEAIAAATDELLIRFQSGDNEVVYKIR